MRLTDFDYELPDCLIAQVPLQDRAASRLLWLHRDGSGWEDLQFRAIEQILKPGDLLVLNDTIVTARRLAGHRKTGAAVEALVLRRSHDGHLALTRPSRKLRPGEVIEFSNGLSATVAEDLGGGIKRLVFDSIRDVDAAIHDTGSLPLPPYIQTRLQNEGRYQTVYGSTPGSAAAPTAGLHFTSGILDRLRSKGVGTAWVTLNVGLDTFRPVSAEDITQHQIHGEECSVPEETAAAIRECRGRVIAVGTTSARTLETRAVGRRRVEAGSCVSKLFVTPGFEFQVIDGMFTNFHLPCTTMLFMVSALAGTERVMAAYRHAVTQEYRFLSFGDSMLIV